jgi:4-methylaminobutanoate oxidase (formaldehyde-forming)
LRRLRYFQSAEAEMAGFPVLAARLSYVGEAGWEITCRTEHALSLYDTLRGAGARPAGLFAQTSMRIEKRFLAYGHELDTEISPLQAGLGFAVGWETNFIGKKMLLTQRESGTRSKIITIVLNDPEAVPLGNEPVLIDGKIVGKTTSGAFGYRLGAPIALAVLHEPADRIAGDQAAVNIAGTLWDATLVHDAAFDPRGLRMKPPQR